MKIFPLVGELIPNRSSFISGTEFIRNLGSVKGSKRDDATLHEFLSGNIPDFLRNFKPLTINVGKKSITYLVMSDYLSIGDGNDYLRMPMSALVAQEIANKYDCSLPTRKMVNDIYHQAEIKLAAKGWGEPYFGMDDNSRFPIQNEKISKQLIGLDKTKLIAGHFKDVVLSNSLAPNNPKKRVSIYGWFLSNGKPIQGLNSSSHNDKYFDYAHGIRLICNDVIVNGIIMRLQEVFKSKDLSPLVSDEGVVKFTEY